MDIHRPRSRQRLEQGTERAINAPHVIVIETDPAVIHSIGGRLVGLSVPGVSSRATSRSAQGLQGRRWPREQK
jgi:hypothetical protein